MVGGKHIFKKTMPCFDKKICLINDLLDFRGNFYTYYNECITIDNVKTNFLEYHGVIVALSRIGYIEHIFLLIS